MKHARLSASAAERWLHCYGSVDAIAALPESPPSPAAAEGTKAHDIAAKLLVNGWHAKSVPEDMHDGIALYFDECKRLTLEKRWVELDLTPALSEWDSDLGGTADFATYSPTKKLLRVVDFKYGAGMFVSAEDNMELNV